MGQSNLSSDKQQNFHQLTRKSKSRTDAVTKILYLELLTKLTFLTERFLKIKCNELDKLLITSHIYTKIYYLSFLTADAEGRVG